MAEKTLNMEQMYHDLLKSYNGIRKLNLQLLEEKREILLRSQDDRTIAADRPSLSLEEIAYPRRRDDACISEKNDVAEKITNLEHDSSCSCSSAKYLMEVVDVNHKWQEKYNSLVSKSKNIESTLVELREELNQERDENTKLRRLVDNLSSDLNNVHSQAHLVGKRNEQNQACYSADDIEALKQQLIAYQEDFANERKDRENAGKENRLLKEKLQETESKVKTLTDEKRRYQQCFGEVSQQQNHLISELRRLSVSSLPFSPVHRSPGNDRWPSNSMSSNADDIIPRSSSPSIRAQTGDFLGARVYSD